jgi:hypothetical protein
VERSLACGASLAVLVGAAWSCASFGAESGAPAPDASTGDASADALDAPPPDAGVGVEGGPGGDAGPPSRGPKCNTAINFCAATEGCCFQFGGGTDACVKQGAACDKVGSSTGAVLLTCTDRASCPGALPFCCLGAGASNVATGSTCQAAACTGPQLCTENNECPPSTTCVGTGDKYSLDPFQTYCSK